MSYTTPQGGEQNSHRTQRGDESELREIVSDLLLDFSGKAYAETAYLPPALRPGKETFEAVRKLMRYETLWFNRADKVKYLLGTETGFSSYHHYWGLLSTIWPRGKSKEVSDLLTRVRPKLTAMLFFAIAGRQEYSRLLPVFFEKYLTKGIRNPARKKIIRSLPLLQNSEQVKDALVRVGTMFASTFQSNLERLEKAKNIEEALEIVHSLFNKQHFVYAFSPEPMIELVKRYSFNLEEPSWDDAILALKQKAIIGVAHLCGKKEWQADWIAQLVNQLSDVRRGRRYALFGTLYFRNKLNKVMFASLEEPDNDKAREEVWSAAAANDMINDSLENTHPPWYLAGGVFQMVNVLRLANFLRSHPHLDVVLRSLPSARLRIKNIARHFLKQYGQQSKIPHIGNSERVQEWAERLERFAGDASKLQL